MVEIDPIIRSTSLSDIAYERIRDSIISGKMKSGEIYSEKEIADQMKVSRTPVREALRQLASESLVTSIPGRGFKVNRFSARDVEELYEFRIALELAVIDKLARDFSRYDFSKAELVIKEQRQAMEEQAYGRFVRVDRQFHSELSKLIGNARIEKALDNSRDVSQLVADYKTMASGRGGEIIAEHEKIMKCLKRGEVPAAREAMETHLNMSLAAVLEIFRDRDSLIGD